MSPFRRAIRVTLGIFLIVIGLAGLLLPIMPGIPFLFLGIALIGINHPLLRPVRGLIERLKARSGRTTAPRR